MLTAPGLIKSEITKCNQITAEASVVGGLG